MTYGSAVSYAYMIGKEATRGTAVTADKDIGLITDVSNDPVRENIEVNSISQIQSVDNKAGTQEGNHTVTFTFQHGRMFEFIIGDAAHANSSSDYSHTFTIDNLPSTWTAESGDNLSSGDAGFQYVNNVVESAEISFEINGTVNMSVTSKSKFPSVLTTIPAQTVSTLTCFTHSDVTVSLNAVAATAVQDFRINFNKVATPVHSSGSVDVLDVIPVELRIAFSGTIVFTDETYHTHFVNNDVTAVTFDATNGIAFGSGKRGVEIDLENIDMTTFRKTVAIGGLVFVEVGGSATLNTLITFDNIADASWF